MAQDFTRYKATATGTSGADILTANSNDAIVSIRLTNRHSAAIAVDCYINDGSSDFYLIKGATIPVASSIELIDGGSRFVVQNNDVLKVDCDTNSALDVWVSVVDAISA